jgi:hypothetical protein
MTFANLRHKTYIRMHRYLDEVIEEFILIINKPEIHPNLSCTHPASFNTASFPSADKTPPPIA